MNGLLTQSKKLPRRGIYQKSVLTYVEPVRQGKKAEKKAEIVSNYSETHQLNIMRKAILGDAAALEELQNIDIFISNIG